MAFMPDNLYDYEFAGFKSLLYLCIRKICCRSEADG